MAGRAITIVDLGDVNRGWRAGLFPAIFDGVKPPFCARVCFGAGALHVNPHGGDHRHSVLQ